MKLNNKFDIFLHHGQMEQVSPGFSERYLMDPQRFKSELEEYKRYVKAMVQLAGAGEKSNDFAEEILEFSTKIAKARIFSDAR